MKPKVAQKRYDDEAIEYDGARLASPQGRVKHQIRLEKIHMILKKAIGNLKGKKILELGVGTGQISTKLALWGADAYGMDVSGEMLKVSKDKAKKMGVKLTLKQGDAASIPYQDDTFDAVIIIHVLAHVEDPKKVVDEAKRVTKKSGVVIFDMYSADNFFIRRGEKRLIEAKKYVPASISIKDARKKFGKVKIVPTQFMLTFTLPDNLIYFSEKLLEKVLPASFARNIIYYYIK